MPRAHRDPQVAWKYRGRVVGFIRDGTYYIDRTIAGARVKVSTRCVTLAAANAEFERFEVNPAAFVSRSGKRACVGLGRSARLRDAHLDRAYSLSPRDLAALQVAQGHRCAICGGTGNGRTLEVDHDHATGAVRGLLCGPCNRGIGQLGDDSARLRCAADYLDRAVAPPGAYAQGPRGTSGACAPAEPRDMAGEGPAPADS